MTVANRPRSARKCRQTGLSQSYWRWLSQHVEMTQRRPGAVDGVRDPHAVGGPAEPDLLRRRGGATRRRHVVDATPRPSPDRGGRARSERHRGGRGDRRPHRLRQLADRSDALLGDEPGPVLGDEVPATRGMRRRAPGSAASASASADVRSTVACPAASAWIRQRPWFQGALASSTSTVTSHGWAPGPGLERFGEVDQADPEAVVGADVGRRPRAAGPEDQWVVHPDLADRDAAHQVEVDEPAQQDQLRDGVADEEPYRRARRPAGTSPTCATGGTPRSRRPRRRAARTGPARTPCRAAARRLVADPLVVGDVADHGAEAGEADVRLAHPGRDVRVGDGRELGGDLGGRVSRPGAVSVVPRPSLTCSSREASP